MHIKGFGCWVAGWLCMAVLSAAEPAQEIGHVIVSHDVSGSMSETYLGPGIHDLLRGFLADMLFNPAGPQVSSAIGQHRVEIPPTGFRGFPLAAGDVVVSSFTFGDRVYPGRARQPLRQSDLAALYPTAFTDQKTDLDGAILHATTKLFTDAEDAAAYWIMISDGKDDPLATVKNQGASEAYLKRDLSLLYRLVVYAPTEIYQRHLREWERSNPSYRRAFGDGGPPEKAVIDLYLVKDKWPAPQRASYEVRMVDEKPVTLLQWYPGEWHPDAGDQGNRPEDSDVRYRVEQRTGDGRWMVVAEVPPTTRFPLEVELPELGEGRHELRIGATRPGKHIRYSPSLLAAIHVIRVDQAPTYTEGAPTTIRWDDPKKEGVFVRIDRMAKGSNAWEEGIPGCENIPSLQGYCKTTAVRPGDTIRWVVLPGDGSVQVGQEKVLEEDVIDPDPSPPGPPVPNPTPTPVPNRGGKIFFLLLLLVLIVGLLIAGIFMVGPRTVSFIIVRDDVRDAAGNPQQRATALRRKERMEFSQENATDEKVIATWEEINAPDDFLVNRWRSIYHVRHSYSGTGEGYEEEEPLVEVEDELASGDTFKVKTRDGHEITLQFYEQKPGTRTAVAEA